MGGACNSVLVIISCSFFIVARARAVCSAVNLKFGCRPSFCYFHKKYCRREAIFGLVFVGVDSVLGLLEVRLLRCHKPIVAVGVHSDLFQRAKDWPVDYTGPRTS